MCLKLSVLCDADHTRTGCGVLTTSCRLDHFGVAEVPDARKDRDLETYRRTVDPKRDTNLRILLASRIYLDACHRDLKFAHPVTRIARADRRISTAAAGHLNSPSRKNSVAGHTDDK
jgi:hypothetical protein